jgi:hypothetical protein
VYDGVPERGDRRRPTFPAYGPVKALLNLLLLYALVQFTTPTLVVTVTSTAPGVSAGLIETAVQLFVWFVFVVTVVDQIRRQQAATRERSLDERRPDDRTLGDRARLPVAIRVPLYLTMVAVGMAVAAWTIERAVGTLLTMIRAVPTMDFYLVSTTDFVTMAVFFLAYALTVEALDRLLIGGLRVFLNG